MLARSLAIEHRGPARFDATGVAALVYLTVVASAAGHTISIWLATVTNATFASSWTYISPFVAIAGGATSDFDHQLPSGKTRAYQMFS